MTSDDKVCYAIVNNIPKIYHASDLRNFFSQFLETNGFCCFHFRHRPEVQKPIETVNNTENISRCVTTCCVIKVYEHRFTELVEMYHRKHWLDRNGCSLPGKCFIKKVFVQDIVEEIGPKKYETNAQLKQIPEDREIFTKNDLMSLIEMKPPPLMPNGNVGTPTSYFLEQIKTCRLPPSIITKLKLEFPRSRARRLYGCVDYDYGGGRFKGSQYKDFIRTSKGDIISNAYIENLEQDRDNNLVEETSEDEEEKEEESEEEEWDRHEALHDDVTSQERLKERLFEEKIELKWEKGGSGLVFYTDAQFWDKVEGDFDAKTADDWDIDTSGYYEPGSGDKDARDLLKMRLEERLRNGNHSEKVDANDFAGFEKYSKGFGRKLLESQGWKEGEGVGKRCGIAEPILDVGQHPHDKKGFGYRGEKLKRQIGPHPKQKRRRKYNKEYDDDNDVIRISTIYDNPLTSDPSEPLLRSSFLTQLKYRKEFLKQQSSE